MDDSNLEDQRRRGSEAALQELDPSPVEETPRDEEAEKKSYFDESSPNYTHTLGLGNHGPTYYRSFSQTGNVLELN